MLVEYRPLDRHSIEWPLSEDLIIPQFKHEHRNFYLISLSSVPADLELDYCLLTWIRDNHSKVYRMVRVVDSMRHGEIYDDNGIPTGEYNECPCHFCNAVKPVPIPS